MIQILKAQSLLECHRYEESRAVCKDIAHQTDVVNDLHLINDLHFLRFRHQKLLSQDQLSSEPDIIQLWQNAAKAQKSKTGVLLQWYGIAVSCDHWEDAQLVSNSNRCRMNLMATGNGRPAERTPLRTKLLILLHCNNSYAG